MCHIYCLHKILKYGNSIHNVKYTRKNRQTGVRMRMFNRSQQSLFCIKVPCFTLKSMFLHSKFADFGKNGGFLYVSNGERIYYIYGTV